MNKLEKIRLWFAGIIAKNNAKSYLKNKETLTCDICYKEFLKQDIGACIYDFDTSTMYCWCKKCNEEHSKIQEEIEKEFLEYCPLHNNSSLFCEECNLKEQCSDKVKEIYKKERKFNYD